MAALGEKGKVAVSGCEVSIITSASLCVLKIRVEANQRFSDARMTLFSLVRLMCGGGPFDVRFARQKLDAGDLPLSGTRDRISGVFAVVQLVFVTILQ